MGKKEETTLVDGDAVKTDEMPKQVFTAKREKPVMPHQTKHLKNQKR
jgi:hypothetical protein